MMVTISSCVYVTIDIYDPDRIYWLTQELTIKSESSMNIAGGRCIMHFVRMPIDVICGRPRRFRVQIKEKDHRLPASGDRLKFKCLNNLITSSNTEQLTTVHNFQLVLFVCEHEKRICQLVFSGNRHLPCGPTHRALTISLFSTVSRAWDFSCDFSAALALGAREPTLQSLLSLFQAIFRYFRVYGCPSDVL